ncbi:unnamed protein product [Medioppia subpectinata]|uniref:Protein kinase domain-containing protein n=1 Tax=Medioppia subpectinata TaxID=1979941 RepID=A0A7R9QB24_9ACAR|nr:unnamed protein product [Medioppia subpectinata]CAG2117799.1 unnamed protein product [Medioppia subpectinata]
MSESRRQELDISNLVFNMSLSRVEIDWPEVSACVAAEPPVKKPYEKFPPRVGDILFGYYLKESLSVGKRSTVFVGYKVAKSGEQSNGSEVIVKVAIERGFDDLRQELHNSRKVKGCRSVGHYLDYIWWKDWQNQHYGIRWGLIVFEKFGPNLLSLMKRSIRRVMEPIESQFAVAVQMIDCIEDIHSMGFIHGSLRPENFVIESETKWTLRLIGLSDAKEFITKRLDGTVEHIEDTSNYRFLPYGDPNFHSIGYHSGFCPSRRDDMESLGYCMIFMAKGSLPWMSASDKNLSSPKTIRKIGKRMKETPLADLCAGLPQNFCKYFDLISGYEFNEKPDYQSLRQCFQTN